MSRLFYPDGRVLEVAPRITYLIWLAAPGTALRVAGDPPTLKLRRADNRPVMPWEYRAGASHR